MAGDLTMFDAPETPAPIFAYRALKGMIFGSPSADEDENNKENIQHPAQSTRAKISSLQSLPLSPSKRRKTNQHQSPAKSILRTPGIPTPRKLNANVTFKDLTPSLSPEIALKSTPSTIPPPCHNVGIKHESGGYEDIVSKPRAARNTPTVKTKPNGEAQNARSKASSEKVTVPFDFDAYRLSTEKEVKKLVRYGQKMREYARKQDEENTKLRLVVEELRKENEAMRLRESARVYSQSDGGGVGNRGRTEVEGQAVLINPFQQHQASRSALKGALGEKKRKLADTLAIPQQKQVADVSKTTSQTQAAQRSPLKRKASSQLLPEPASSLPPQNTKSPIRVLPVRAANVRLPADRLAAARERIRLKAEMRRAEANRSSPVEWDAL